MASVLKVNEIQHTGGTSAMTIDSSGRVSEPQKPYIIMDSNYSSSIVKNSSAICPFNNVLESRGITLDTSTYKFQVPVTGLYHFSGAVRWNNGSSYLWWRVEDGNGVPVNTSQLILECNNASSFITSAGSTIATLSASTDYQIGFGDGANNTSTISSGQTFMGIYLVG